MALTYQLASGNEWFNEPFWTSLAIAGSGYAALAKLWPRASHVPQRRGVAQVRLGPAVGGSAFRVRGRLVVTSIDVVNKAMGRSPGEGAVPPAWTQLVLEFSGWFGPGSQNGRSARVMRWGPAHNDRDHNEAVVLRTDKRLPWGIPCLPIARGRYQGPVNIVLPQGILLDARDPGPHAVEIDSHRLVITPGSAIPRPAGAPVLSADPDDLTLSGEVVALCGMGPEPDGLPPQGSGAVPRLVEAQHMQALVQTVSRRAILQAGALAGGVAALGGGGLFLVGGSDPPALLGAGWRDLFMNPAVREYLGDQGFVIDRDFSKLSGGATLKMGDRLADFDFVTAPNEIIQGLVVEQGPFHGAASATLCAEEMVIVTTQLVAQGLSRDGGLVLPDDGYAALDVQKYLKNYKEGRTWKAIGASGKGRSEGLIKLAGSNPLSAGGGQMFLWLQAQASAAAGLGDPEWLWSPEGPMDSLLQRSTTDLFVQLGAGFEQMIFVYEHDAIDFLNKYPHDGYVMLRPYPKIALTQKVVTTNSAFADVFEHMSDDLAQILMDRLYLRVPGYDEKVDEYLNTQLSSALWKGHVPEPKDVLDREIPNPQELQRLVKRMERYVHGGTS